MKIFAILLTVSTHLFALCYETNNFKSNPKLIDLEIVNQGDMSTCYAHTLSSLYNTDIAKADSEKIHPYWIAYKHKDRIIHWSPKNMDFSLLSWAWSDMLKHSVCDYETAQSLIDSLKKQVPYSDDQLFYLFKTFFKAKRFKNIRRSRSYKKSLDKTLSLLLENSSGFERAWLAEDIKKIFDPLRSKIGSKGLFKFLRKKVFNKCKDSLISVSGRLINTARKKESNNKVLASMINVLKEGKSLSIGYCSRPVIKLDPRTSKDIDSKLRIFKAFANGCSAHYSMVVGSRLFENKCELLVRNSYGKDFWAHESNECLCEDLENGRQFNCKKPQSQGYRVLGCWIKSEKLLNNTFDLSYFR